jgi:hypothetical protein
MQKEMALFLLGSVFHYYFAKSIRWPKQAQIHQGLEIARVYRRERAGTASICNHNWYYNRSSMFSIFFQYVIFFSTSNDISRGLLETFFSSN